jgi:hypothetical protein
MILSSFDFLDGREVDERISGCASEESLGFQDTLIKALFIIN